MTRPLRLLLFTVAFEEGGGERLYVNLLRGLDRSLFEPSLVCWKVHESHFLEELPDDVPLVDLGRGGRFRRELPRLLAGTVRAFRRFRPDVVMSISTELNLVLYAARRLAGSRARIVLNEQGSPSAWLSLIREAQPLRALAVRQGYARLPHSARVVCVAESVRQDLIESFGCDPARLVTIPNPVDLERVRALAGEPAPLPFPADGRPLVVSTGRFFPQKGYDVLARAFVRVAAENDARLLVVGDGPERPTVERILADAGVADRAALVGYRANPFPYVAAGTVFALPSLSEGFGYVLAEAMALGIPVVSSDAAGPADILAGGRHGTLVPAGGDAALAESLLTLLRNEGRRRELAESGRARAEEFGLGPVLARYQEVLAGAD